MLWNDLREYVARLDELGFLRHVNGAHWNLELGAICEMMVESGGPALLFDDIPDYPHGFRVLSNVEKHPRRHALALGLDHTKTLAEMASDWEKRVKGFKPIPPRVVATGPVMENVVEGADVNMLSFPTPMWHEKDGNRYIGTGVAVIQKDPDTGFVNAGAYRVAVHDEKTCIIFTEPNRHGDIIRRKHWDRGEKAPVLVSVGQEPILFAMSGGTAYSCGDGLSEFEAAGFFHGSPYPVVLSPRTGIPMPATAEIVIEGYMPSPDEALIPEGPFGEWTGYYAHGRSPETPIEVTAVYYRNNPIIWGSPPTRPVRLNPEFGDFDITTKHKLEAAGIPGIQNVFNLSKPCFKVISVNQMYDEHLDEIVQVIEPGGFHHTGNHVWVLVDEDIDPSNPQEVMWAISSRLIPHSGVRVVEGTADWQLDPRVPPGQRSAATMDHSQDFGRKPYTAHNLILNCCRPFEWRDQFPKVNVNSPELRHATREKWKDLFDGA
ncbi:MAG: UbiD family decarboxylase [Chloroflexi bacterium]|nr:UbiD family decarboxylase [Chloroflexota bacterium]